MQPPRVCAIAIGMTTSDTFLAQAADLLGPAGSVEKACHRSGFDAVPILEMAAGPRIDR